MSKIIKLNEGELTTLVEKIFKTTLFENKIIRIVENRGMFPNHRHIIEPIISYVEKYIRENEPNNEIYLNAAKGQIPAFLYIVEIPESILKGLSWVYKKSITIKVFDIDNETIKIFGYDNLSNYRYAYYNVNMEDKLTDNKLLESLNIKMEAYSLNGKLFVQNIQSSLYHEITHAYENYSRLLKMNKNVYDALNKTNYRQVSKNLNNEFNYITYYLLTQYELNANIASSYGDFERMKSERKNFSQDLKNTSAYKTYNIIKNDYLPKLIKLDDQKWGEFQKEIYPNSTETINAFKKDFIKYVDLKLNDLYRGIGKVASQYYDDHELKNEFENTTIRTY